MIKPQVEGNVNPHLYKSFSCAAILECMKNSTQEKKVQLKKIYEVLLNSIV